MAYEPRKDIEMAGKRRKAEENVTKLRQVDVLNAQGKSMAEAIRSIGVTEVIPSGLIGSKESALGFPLA